MLRKHQAEQLLRQGLGPYQIAAEMGISVASVVQYLRTRVGERALKLSDIFFAIPRESRDVYEAACANGNRTVHGKGISRDEYELFQQLKHPSCFRGDLYEHVSTVELRLHDLTRDVLKSHYGENCWWRNGVPVNVRKECVVRREEDDDPIDDEFAYTTLIHLKVIIDKNWNLFKDAFPKRWANQKQDFLRACDRLNLIRNAVMHPVKKRTWTETDFEFVRDFARGPTVSLAIVVAC